MSPIHKGEYEPLSLHPRLTDHDHEASESNATESGTDPDGPLPYCFRIADVTQEIAAKAERLGMRRCATCRKWLPVGDFGATLSCSSCCARRSKRRREGDDEGGGGEGGGSKRKSVKV
jgi:hypothetical protein